MKKQVLFIIPSLDSGGAEKSLVNLLNSFDYESYAVDLVMLREGGVFLHSIPTEVNKVKLSEDYTHFTKSLVASCLHFLSHGKVALAWHRLLFTLVNRFQKNTNKAEQYSWKHLSKTIQLPPKKYDAAIGYLEKTSIYLCVDCVSATQKIGFIRTDYEQLHLDVSFDERYFSTLDAIMVNGSNSLETLKKCHPKLAKKMSVMMNVVSPQLIQKRAAEYNPFEKNTQNIVSVGRLDHVKGYDLAIRACAKMVQSNPNIKWFVIGEGSERVALERQIKEEKLENQFVLLGEKENPYSYMSNATIYAQTSRFEGRSSTINEAKILAKPIVVTNFDSVFEQIQSGVNGLIVEKDADAIADAIVKLLNDSELQMQFIKQLQSESLGTETEIQKLFTIIQQ